jgi:REP element-mobilizing transposase RayT
MKAECKSSDRAGACRPGNSPGRHGPAPRANFPLAYHITWGTYGTRLHGDTRGTVHHSENQYGDPIIGKDGEWQKEEALLLRFPMRILTIEQRLFIERTVPGICNRGKWDLITVAAGPDHVHAVLRAAVDGKDIRKWLKRWLSEAMSERWPIQPGEVWWAECGSVKWVWNRDYYNRVVNYVQRQVTIQ